MTALIQHMQHKIGIIGLGYVGLPLARLFATKYAVVGFDVNPTRIQELSRGEDHTLEIEPDALNDVLKTINDATAGLYPSIDLKELESCNTFIVTVPTPVDETNTPDLTPLIKATETVARVLKKGDTVIYESTVFPGATEEVCVPLLEKLTGLKYNVDFAVGYSPERINPGDKLHTVDKILKVTSGSNPEAAIVIDQLYASVITAGTHLAPTIKVAEAAKVIENSQRDINIAFINELAKIFNLLEINTQDVLEAAGTKWNFLPFTPGLVGGHCIGVDPYYLAQKAQAVGYNPEIIIAGRRMNDSMGQYVASEVIKLMIQRDIAIKGAKILVLGITFKENCPDVRNTKVVDLIRALEEYGAIVTVYDPIASTPAVRAEYGIENHSDLPKERFDALVGAVKHKEFDEIDLSILSHQNTAFYDVKGVFGDKAHKSL